MDKQDKVWLKRVEAKVDKVIKNQDTSLNPVGSFLKLFAYIWLVISGICALLLVLFVRPVDWSFLGVTFAFFVFCLTILVSIHSSPDFRAFNISAQKVKSNKNTLAPIKTWVASIWNIRWALLALLIFMVLWGQIGFYPLSTLNQLSTSNQFDLPTAELVLSLSGGGRIGVSCLQGEVFGYKMVQGDILKCKLKLYDADPTIQNGTIKLYVMSLGSIGEGEGIPQDDYNENEYWYRSDISPEQFEKDEAYFFIKVPPVHYFTFFTDLPGYYGSILPFPSGWYTTTEFEEYLRGKLPLLELLGILFGVFGGVYYLRKLFE